MQTSRSLMLLAAALLAGCASISTVSRIDDAQGPVFYTGTRLDWAGLSGNSATLQRFAHYGCEPPRYPLLDLPLSMAADTLLLPLSLNFYLFQKLQ